MQTTLYMLHQQSNFQMMSFIIQTSEGKLIVIDGGMPMDGDHLVDTLIQLGGPQPTVDMWILTHPHVDHIGALLDIFSKPHPLKIKKIYSHFWSYDFYMCDVPYAGDFELDSETLKGFAKLQEQYPDLLLH